MTFLLDDCGFVWQGLPATPMLVAEECPRQVDLDTWFSRWARTCVDSLSRLPESGGAFLINAHARITRRATRQDLEGVEVLKHIRLTPWIGELRSWHAIVCSFEPLGQILQRKPGSLILVSPGVTFLRLPEATGIRDALVKAYPLRADEWRHWEANEIVAELANVRPATHGDRGFRAFVSCDYTPDPPHSISNWWGIYEMFRALPGFVDPEGQAPLSLPHDVVRFINTLECKKARHLDTVGVSKPTAEEGRQAANAAVRPGQLEKTLVDLAAIASGKTIAYVDDEAGNGWDRLLGALLNGTQGGTATAELVTPDVRNGDLALKSAKWTWPLTDEGREHYEHRIRALAEWVAARDPDLLILDLRLLGRDEEGVSPDAASGMQVAREIRSRRPYLPVLLFTASNKAETVLISRALDVDDYWMKPGLGEHRSERGRDEDLWALSTKIQGLLGPRYTWLTRVGDEVQKIEVSTVPHWWERDAEWPAPVCQRPGRPPETGTPEIISASENARGEVVGRMRSVLHTMRLVFRLGQERGKAVDGPPSAVDVYRQPKELEYALRASVLMQVGQVVELVHRIELDDTFRDPFSASKNARIGGWGNPGVSVFRRRDWWAFRLYQLRNEAAHFYELLQRIPDGKLGEHELIGDRSLVHAVSDVVAWLIVPQSTVQSIELVGAGMIAKKCGESVVFRMHPRDPPKGSLRSPDRTNVNMRGISGDDALTDLFRRQVHLRGGYVSLSKESTRLLGSADSL